MTDESRPFPASNADRLAALPVQSRLPWGRMASACILLALLAWIINAFAHGRIEWAYVGRFLFVPAILRGVLNTLLMSVCAMALGTVVGLLLATGRQSDNIVARGFSIFYVWLFRGVPAVLQLLIWFNLALIFPTIHIPGAGSVRTVDVMSPFLSALLGLGLNQAAYISEIIRAGLKSIDNGQYEAAQAIGMPPLMVLSHIVLPQAMRIVIPPLGNEFISLIKMTSLASMIQFPEVLHNAETIYYANNRVMELLLVAGIWYLLIVTILAPLQNMLETRVSRGQREMRR